MNVSRSDLCHEDDDLVVRAKGGDREAFGRLVTRHQRRIWLVCRQYLGVDDADAATQDSFVKAFTKIGAFDHRAAFTTWLTRIAINTCLDELRRRRREGEIADDSGDSATDVLTRVPDRAASPEKRTMEQQAVDRLRVCEQGLAPRQREIFRLRFYAELELDDIAEALGVHVGTVKTQLHRAVHRLRQELGEHR